MPLEPEWHGMAWQKRRRRRHVLEYTFNKRGHFHRINIENNVNAQKIIEIEDYKYAEWEFNIADNMT